MKLSLITAHDRNLLIGDKNALPWRLPADLQYFKRVTLGKPIVMGRKTYESIGRPLPGRQNIVLSRNTGLKIDGVDVVSHIDDAITIAGDAEELMIIGGAALYKETVASVERMYITLVNGEFTGDAWFPKYDLTEWREHLREDHEADDKNEAAYSFVVYDRSHGSLISSSEAD